MKFIFLVQGEGRGHMTQALALHQILTKTGHEVGAVFVGKNSRREIPSYFSEKINCPVYTFLSPNFVTDKQNKSIKIWSTIFRNLFSTPAYLSGLNQIHTITKEYQPDIIINFYDILGGIYNFIYRPKAKTVAIAHQFLAAHPDFPFAPARPIDKRAYFLLNLLTGYRAASRFCLSFRPYPPHPGLTIVPPLLRSEIHNLSIQQGDYIHGYILNDGYSEEVKKWHADHPEVPLYFFWDKKGVQKETHVDPNLVFHTIDDRKFLEKMAGCKAYVSTAGFESICEAMYLGKPIMMIPVTGHYEQACNALDAVAAGAGITSHEFNLSLLLDYLSQHSDIREEFRAWADQSPAIILRELEKVVKV